MLLYSGVNDVLDTFWAQQSDGPTGFQGFMEKVAKKLGKSQKAKTFMTSIWRDLLVESWLYHIVNLR